MSQNCDVSATVLRRSQPVILTRDRQQELPANAALLGLLSA